MRLTIYELKPAFQNLLRPLTRALYRWGVTANHVTLFAMLLSIATGAVIAWEASCSKVLLLLPPVLFVRMALNAIDGMLAREHGLKSPLGAILNELGDVVSDAALYLPLALHPNFSAPLVVAVVLLSVFSEMAGVLGVTIGASRRYDGPSGKSDRAFLLGALGLALGLGATPGRWIDALLALMAVLLTVTILNRSRAALRELGSR